MSLLAASLGFVLGAAEWRQIEGVDLAAWRRIEPCIVRILNANQPVGVGVLIDSSGYFLAHRASSSSPVLFGRLASGETIQLAPVSVDEVTQLVLLRAEGWRPAGRTPASVAATSSALQKASINNSVRVLLVTTDGPVRGELTQSSLIGVMAPSRRGLTLAELRFEAPDRPYGGGLVFTTDGRLAGVVGATLETQAPREASKEAPGAQAFGAQSDVSTALGRAGSTNRRNFGPATMAVGYSITPDILERVVEGFLSASRKVEHPALGLMCQDSPGGGALIVSLTPGAAAEKAGLRPGDVILEMDGLKVTNQMDYTRVLLRQRVGETVTVKIRRGGEERSVDVRIGK